MKTPKCDPQDEALYLPLAARAARHGMVLTDTSGRITWVNESFERLSGFSLSELRGRRPSELLHGPETDPDTVARMREARAQGRSCTELITNYRKDGRIYRVLVEAVPVHDEQQRLVRFFAITWQLGSDISEQDDLSLDRSACATLLRAGSLLPICAWCKNVRTPDDHWHTIEDYLDTTFRQQTTSTICPVCVKKFE